MSDQIPLSEEGPLFQSYADKTPFCSGICIYTTVAYLQALRQAPKSFRNALFLWTARGKLLRMGADVLRASKENWDELEKCIIEKFVYYE